MTDYEKLFQKTKDCGVFYGIYSKEYIAATKEMTEFYRSNVKPKKAKRMTYKELFLAYKNRIQFKITSL